MIEKKKVYIYAVVMLITVFFSVIFIGYKGYSKLSNPTKPIINSSNNVYLDSQSVVDFTIYEPEYFFTGSRFLNSKSIPCGKSRALSVTYELATGGFIRVTQMPKGLTCVYNSLMKTKTIHKGLHSNYKLSLDCSSAVYIKCDISNIKKFNSKIELSKNGHMNFNSTSIVITGKGATLENYQNFIKGLKPVLDLKKRNMRLVNLKPGENNDLKVKVGEYIVLKIDDRYTYRANITDKEFAIYIRGSHEPYFQPTAILIEKKGKATINLEARENGKISYKVNLKT